MNSSKLLTKESIENYKVDIKYILVFVIFVFNIQIIKSQTDDSSSIFQGINKIFLDLTTLEDLKNSYSYYRIDKPRYPERVIYLNSLGIVVYCQKVKFRNEYIAKRIIITDKCEFKSKNGIGIESTHNEISEVYPVQTSLHSSRLLKSTNIEDKKITYFHLRMDSSNVRFISYGWKNSENFTTDRIEIYSNEKTDPYTRPTMVFMGLPRIEYTTDFISHSIYAGFGFYTTYFITGNIGPEIRFNNNDLIIGPKASLGFWLPSIPGFQFNFKAFTPYRNNTYDLILNPQIGMHFPLGFFYAQAGYNFNITNNFDIPDSFNLSIGIQLPLNMEKFVSNM